MTETIKHARTRKPGRPTKPLAERRTERISFGVTKAQKASFLVNAAASGLPSNDFARKTLCHDPDRAVTPLKKSRTFELIDVLSRIGADLTRLRFIAEETDTVPVGIDEVIATLDRKLDALIVGSGIADELNAHRKTLLAIGAQLDRKKAMTTKARGMITTFDRVVNKVLSA